MRIAYAVMLLAACSRAPQRPLSPSEVRAQRTAQLPSDPADPRWDNVPVHAAQLLPQDVVEPRVLAATTPSVEAQALTDGKSIAFRLSWAGGGNDKQGPAVFSDACAVQLPAQAGDLPNPMMGEAQRPVEITYWRASWQATVNGRPDTLEALYPTARVDTYPFESASLQPGSPEQRAMALRFAPARAVGNTMAGPRDRPVQDLVASGPGTLRPAAVTVSTGSGKPSGGGWSVVMVRPIPPWLAGGGRSQVAFAIWQGGKGEAGARKMRTGWIPLAIDAQPIALDGQAGERR